MRTRRPLRVGLVGHGVLARRLHEHLAASAMPAEVSGVLVRRAAEPPEPLRWTTSMETFLAMGHDVVVECAGQAALRMHGEAVLRAGIDMVPASVGVLADDDLLRSMLRAAASSGARLRLPSGAIAGIDGLAAARHGGIDEVLYRGTMPPHALVGHVPGTGRRSELVFSGTAREAVARFPKNANLTGTISLAGIGFDRTRVEMIVDRRVTANIHELQVTGDFGHFSVTVQGQRISTTSPSSRIVAGSLAQAALGSGYTLIHT